MSEQTTVPADTALYEEICPVCGGYGRVDAGYTEQYAARDRRCSSCAGTGRIIVERERVT